MSISGYTKFGVGLNESEKRERIQEAAKKVFGRVGYHKATVQDIISEAGISRRTFYSYFKGKEDVLVRILDRFAMDVKRAKDIEVPDKLHNVEEFRDQIERLVRAIIAIILENREIIKLFFEGLVMDDKVLSPRSENMLNTFNALNKEYIAAAQRKGLMYGGDAEIISSMLLGIYMEMVRKFLIKNDRPPVDRFIEELLSLFDSGPFRKDGNPA